MFLFPFHVHFKVKNNIARHVACIVLEAIATETPPMRTLLELVCAK